MIREVTTIKLSRGTVALLNKLKIHPRQSYEEIILILISEHEIGREGRKFAAGPAFRNISGQVTTIKLSRGTVALLNKLKIHPRQSYEEVVYALNSKKWKKKK